MYDECCENKFKQTSSNSFQESNKTYFVRSQLLSELHHKLILIMWSENFISIFALCFIQLYGYSESQEYPDDFNLKTVDNDIKGVSSKSQPILELYFVVSI